MKSVSPAPPEVLIFDLDDTLVDTSAIFYTARESFVAFMREKKASESLTREVLSNTEDRNLARFGYVSERSMVSMRETYECLAERGKLVPSSADLRRIASIGGKGLYTMPKPFPYAKRLLAWCATRFRLAMVTRGSVSLQHAKLSFLGLHARFEIVRVVNLKTAAVFSEVADALHVRPEVCVSIGDSMRFDILTALQVRMRAIHVIYPRPAIQWEHDKAEGVRDPNMSEAPSLQGVRALLEDGSVWVPSRATRR